MSKKNTPEWEIVDSIPGERKKAAREAQAQQRQPRFPKKFWIGAGIGAVVVVAFPPAMRMLMNLFRNLVAYWWLLLVFAAYWFIRRRLKR